MRSTPTDDKIELSKQILARKVEEEWNCLTNLTEMDS